MHNRIFVGVVAAVLFISAVAGAQSSVKAVQASGGQGPWYQSAARCATVLPDGGSPYQLVQLGNNALPVPNIGTPNRLYVNVCSSDQNATAGVLAKCKGDGVAPVYAAGNPGDVLATGDCVVYSQQPFLPDAAVSLNCITNIDAGNYVTAFECVPGL